MAATSTLSVISCRVTRPGLAPIANRSAISRARIGARLASSPATFAHATKSTAAASNDSITISSAFGGDPARRSYSVRTVSNVFRFVS